MVRQPIVNIGLVAGNSAGMGVHEKNARQAGIVVVRSMSCRPDRIAASVRTEA
jgi:hypothetical protein